MAPLSWLHPHAKNTDENKVKPTFQSLTKLTPWSKLNNVDQFRPSMFGMQIPSPPAKEPCLWILPLLHRAACLRASTTSGTSCTRARWTCTAARGVAAGHDLEGQGGDQGQTSKDVEDHGVVQAPQLPVAWTCHLGGPWNTSKVQLPPMGPLPHQDPFQPTCPPTFRETDVQPTCQSLNRSYPRLEGDNGMQPPTHDSLTLHEPNNLLMLAAIHVLGISSFNCHCTNPPMHQPKGVAIMSCWDLPNKKWGPIVSSIPFEQRGV